MSKDAPGACCRSAMMVPLDSRACALAQQCYGFGKRVYGGAPQRPRAPQLHCQAPAYACNSRWTSTSDGSTRPARPWTHPSRPVQEMLGL